MSAPVVVNVLALPVPEGSRARRAWLRVVGPAEVRLRCGISRVTVARALGVSQYLVRGWETGRSVPVGERGTAYLRVVAALARHLQVPDSLDDDTNAPLLGAALTIPNGRNKMFKRVAAATAVSVIAAAALAGCGSSQEPLTYAPAAYGISGHCYYVDDPAEALALRAAGLCPASWVPTLMPLAWHETYWDYYDSPAYYTVYVPAKARTVYVHHETSFGHTYHAAITARSKTATYRTSSGTTVKGSKLTGKVKFGSGTSFGTSKYGSGSLRSGSSSKSGTSKSGSTGPSSYRSGSSGSSRSGSLRSGGSSSRSSRSH